MQHLLVLAGTGEARKLLAWLVAKQRFQITASLAGVTSAPLPLGVTTRTGGFGGVAGLADYVRQYQIDTVIDMTHPYATQMSAHAACVAQQLSLPTIAFYRPEWAPNSGDQWFEFESWRAMADAAPTNASLFVAGGSRDLDYFYQRPDINLLIRGLNLQSYKIKKYNIKHINKLPNKLVEEEVQLLRDHEITHICCKNSGGTFSEAKLLAARQLGVPVWMLARPMRLQPAPFYQVFEDVEFVMQALAS